MCVFWGFGKQIDDQEKLLIKKDPSTFFRTKMCLPFHSNFIFLFYSISCRFYVHRASEFSLSSTAIDSSCLFTQRRKETQTNKKSKRLFLVNDEMNVYKGMFTHVK